MIIECYYCESKVDAKILAEHISPGRDDFPFETRTYFLECPVCNNPMIGTMEENPFESSPDKPVFTLPQRVWPYPEKSLDWIIPEVVRNSLEEARRCYKAKAHRACAVMCGTALEGISVQFTSKRALAEGLKELLNKNTIDSRIYEWGETLRQHRNISAHATKEYIGKEDAKDLLDFTNSICDYIYVLTAKFDRFKERQAGKNKINRETS